MSHITTMQNAFMNIKGKDVEKPLASMILSRLQKRVEYGRKLDHEFAVKRALAQAEKRMNADEIQAKAQAAMSEDFLQREEENASAGYVSQ